MKETEIGKVSRARTCNGNVKKTMSEQGSREGEKNENSDKKNGNDNEEKSGRANARGMFSVKKL